MPAVLADRIRDASRSRQRSRHLGALASQALIAEAELTPKPGLVDRRGPGVHHDLSLDLMRRSAKVLDRTLLIWLRPLKGEFPIELCARNLPRSAGTQNVRCTGDAGGQFAQGGRIPLVSFRTGAVLARAFMLAISCVISYWLITHILASTYSISRDDGLLGGMWAVAATIFVYRYSHAESVRAARTTPSRPGLRLRSL
jgi:hypothetical protein